ncbi:SCO3374 family protein [Uniformispora flossi]|uniref:SCO3374 family protein n=1 Tax=Uniformispora flossi TaxID=3390723 RepID=UPI003C2CC8C6
MAATLLFAPRSAPVVPGPLDEALWYARSLGWPVLPERGRTEPSETAGADTGAAWPTDPRRAATAVPGQRTAGASACAAGRGGAADAAVGGAGSTGSTGQGATTNGVAGSAPGTRVGATAGSVDPAVILGWWGTAPRRAVRLAAGVHFDVLDVPGRAGTRALRRAEQFGMPVGPVAATAGGRMQFFVAPGVAESLPELLDWLDWAGLDLDLRAFGAGDSVPAPSPWPATWLAPWPRAWEASRWLRAPAASRLRCAAGSTPEPLMAVDVRFPDVTRLLSGLAHACQQVRLLPRRSAGTPSLAGEGAA